MKRLLFCILLVFICLFSFGQSKTKGQQLLDKATRDWKSFFVDITSVNYSDIIYTTEQAVEELKKTSDSLNICKALILLNDLYSERLEYSGKIVDNYKDIREHLPVDSEGYLIMAKSSLATFMSNYRPQYSLSLMASINSYDDIPTVADLIRVAYCMASICYFMGDYVSANMFYGLLSGYNEDLLDDYSLVWLLMGRSDYALYELSCLGNKIDAFTIFNDCLDIIKKRNLYKSMAFLLLKRNLGIACYRTQSYDDAISVLKDLEDSDINRKLFGEESFANIINLQILSETYMGLGQYDKADSLIERAIEIVDKYFDINSLIGMSLYGTYAHYFSSQKKYEQSSDAYRKGINISETIKFEDPQAYANLSINLHLAKRQEEALEETSIGLEKEREHLHHAFLSLSEKGRESYWTTRGYHNIRLYSIVAADPYDRKGLLYDLALLSKGFLLESSSLFLQLMDHSPDEDLKEEWNSYLQLQDELKQLESISAGDKKHIEQIRIKLLEKESRLMVKASSFKDYLEEIECTWKDVVKNLDKNSVAIEFVRYNDWETREIIYYASVLQGDGPPVNVRLTNFDEKAIQDWSFNKRYKSNALYKVIFEPLSEYLKGKTKIYYAPVGCLNNIAIENVPISKKKYMSDKYEIHRLSSTRMISSLNEQVKISSATLFGGLNYNMSSEEKEYYASTERSGSEDEHHNWSYLPESLEEVKKISAKLSQIEPTVISGSEGIEERFKSLSGKKTNLIHIATHGYYDQETLAEVAQINLPIEDIALKLSGLVFSGANDTSISDSGIDDGLLSAEEISKLNLIGCDLVVLSACGTGLGLSTSFDESYGLIRAFKKAGCKSILMSLWDVDDKASRLFMDIFYQSILSGHTKSEAVDLARKKVRDIYSDPKYWAPFVLID